MSRLSGYARAYIGATWLFGLACLVYAFQSWRPGNWGEFAWYLLCALLSSKMKVTLPGMTGTLSVNYVFILMSITELDLPRTLIIACSSGVVQAILMAKARPRVVQVAFTFSNMAVSGTLAYLVKSALGNRYVTSVPLLLVLCATVYFLANTWSVAGIIALSERKPFWSLWVSRLLWTGPHYLVGAAIAAVHHGFVQSFGWQNSVLVLPAAYLVYRSYRLYLDRLEEEKRHVSEIAGLHLRTIKALALAIDAKDGTTADHLRRVQVYAGEIAKELGVDEQQSKALEAASLLHDIGKLAVPEHIISKPGRLTPEEFEKMKIHPSVGAEILESVDFPYPVVPIVLSHHERWDGSGYPQGLKGEQIPIGARILSAVDALDALTSDRQYRRALPLDKAMEKIAADAGTSFDPAVIEVLARRYPALEALARTSSAGGGRLSNRTVSHNSAGPKAGFETTSVGAAALGQGPAEFLASIAAARQEFQMLLEIATELGSSLRVDETLSLLASKLLSVIPYHAIAIYVVKGANLTPQFTQGENSELFGALEIPLGQGLSGWVAENGKPIVNGNPSVEPGYLKDPTKFSTLRSGLSVPLPGIDGITGVLTLYHRDPDAFTADHLRILMAISTKAGLTIENALRYSRAEKSATTDELTGLPNARSLFLQLDAELARCRRSGSGLAVMVLDLDGFKAVNDRFGHLVGNRILKSAAQGIRDTCREYDYVARMGGDEFVILMPGLNSEKTRARQIDLYESVTRSGWEVCNEDVVSASVGEAFFPEDGHDAEQLLTEADRRMYQMKHLHHNQRRVPAEAAPQSLSLTRTDA